MEWGVGALGALVGGQKKSRGGWGKESKRSRHKEIRKERPRMTGREGQKDRLQVKGDSCECSALSGLHGKPPGEPEAKPSQECSPADPGGIPPWEPARTTPNAHPHPLLFISLRGQSPLVLSYTILPPPAINNGPAHSSQPWPPPDTAVPWTESPPPLHS